jgi:beta-N-acetylhexosaminidase
MPVLSSLSQPPFSLPPSDISWVKKTLDGMSTDAKVRQLFVHITMGDDLATIDRLTATNPGGIHRFMGNDLEAAWKGTRRAVENGEIPMLITGDLEGGGHLSKVVTAVTNQLGLAAANDLALSERSVGVIAAEAVAMGYNWSFTPVVDVNRETGSAIVGTRSYGSDVDKIIAQALVNIKVMQAHGIAATAKHWPGEGFDMRDQHLVTTINPLPFEEWDKVFGRIYRKMFAANVMSVMSAHIALPSWAAKCGVAEGLERYRPASVSKFLTQDLLRGHMGFNGLVVSDATLMAGLGSWTDRETAVPQVIEAGCDMFLFCDDVERDIRFMFNGLRDGRLSEQRLEDSVTRILGLKAALGLHRKSIDERVPQFEMARRVIKSTAHQAAAIAAIDHSITLVKDTTQLLPITPQKHKRITLINRGAANFMPGAPREPMTEIVNELNARGFVTRNHDPKDPPTRDNTDLLIYVLAVESSLVLSRIFIDWGAEHPGFPSAMQRYWHDVPTIMLSFGHPYFLYDAPRVPTYINAYSTIEAAQVAVVQRLVGEAPFTGVSPVDAFSGAPDSGY